MNQTAQKSQEAHSQFATQTRSGAKRGIQQGLCWDRQGQGSLTAVTHAGSHVDGTVAEGMWQAQGELN